MVKFKENIPLSKYSNYKIGGPSRYFFAARTIQDLKSALAEAKQKKLKVFILGGGTNLIFPDDGWKGLTLRVEVSGLRTKGNMVTAGAGVFVSDLLRFVSQNGLTGLEWAGGLPGMLGGAVRGNAGCFGGETKDAVESVRTLNTKTLRETTWTNRKCEFRYRSSIFKESDGEEIILEVTFRLAKGDPKKIRSAIQEKIDYRNARHPMEYPSIGSIFKNVPADQMSKAMLKQIAHVVKQDPFPVVPTAYLISEAGLKGVAYGGAMISPKHPNFIVNVLNASASDVKALIVLAQSEVKKKFGVRIEPEIIEVT